MPVQRRKLSAWLQSGLKNQGPTHAQLTGMLYGRIVGNRSSVAKQRRYQKAYHGSSSGGGGSRSEAARKAWRTRRGH